MQLLLATTLLFLATTLLFLATTLLFLATSLLALHTSPLALETLTFLALKTKRQRLTAVADTSLPALDSLPRGGRGAVL